jgi:hypothetical protein
VAAERVADGGVAVRVIHERQRFEVVEAAQVVPDGLHRAAGHVQRFQIRLIVRQQRIARRERHEAALGQFGRILAVRFAAESHDDLEADFVLRGMQAEHGGRFRAGQRCFRNAQISRHLAAGLRGVGDQAAHVAAAVDFLDDLRIKRTAHLRAGQGTGDLLKACQRLFAAAFPFGGVSWRSFSCHPPHGIPAGSCG